MATRVPAMTNMEKALDIVAGGTAVFPIDALGHKLHSVPSGNPSIIKTWFRRWPHAGIAIKLGLQPGGECIIAIEIDGSDEAARSVERLTVEHGAFSSTFKMTRSDGAKLLIYKGAPVSYQATELAPGVRILGSNAFFTVRPAKL